MRKSYKLIPVKSEIDTVKLIYNKFSELQSLTKLETYCMQHDIKSKNENFYSRSTLRIILSNPVYAKTDKPLYDYLVKNGYDVYSPPEDFDGACGVMAYNKTLQTKHSANKQRNPSEWIIAVGKHKGIIPSSIWIEVQSLLSQNKSKSFRRIKNSESLLSGLLHCAKCGSFMRPRTSGRINENGSQVFYYMCELKEKSHRQLCDVKNAAGNELDRLVLNEIKKLSGSSCGLGKKIAADIGGLKETYNAISSEIDSVKVALKANEQAIANLVENTSHAHDTAAAKYLIDKINTLDIQSSELKNRLLKLQNAEEKNRFERDAIGMIDSLVTAFAAACDTLDGQAPATFCAALSSG